MKTRFFLSLLGIAAILLPALGKDKHPLMYPVPLIDSTLRKDARAVCREYRQEFIIQGPGKAVEKVHKVVTILNDKGSDYGELILAYDKSRSVNFIEGRCYNMLGIQDEKLKESKIEDVNYTSEGAIYDDYRMKLAKLQNATYPCTVEYNYEISYSGLINYPEWNPVPNYRYSVEKSSFAITFPDTMKIRFREFRMPEGACLITHEKGMTTMEWTVKKIPAYLEEPFSQALEELTPKVMTAPFYFQYEKSSGNMKSWEDYGKWVASLIQGRDELPPQRCKELKEMVAATRDTVEIIRQLYRYMQQRTHYIGIQLGIGGFQPFPAETVDKLGYGDCKALSIYMKSLLKAVGIPSCYTVAGAAENKGITLPDFPTNGQTNHIILFVPLKKDTVWMECTSQTAPCGFLGTSTAGRTALQITGDGGKLVRTPLLTADQNYQICKAQITLDATGEMHSQVSIASGGYQYAESSDLLDESKTEQEKDLYKKFSIAGLKIANFTIQAEKIKLPKLITTANLQAPAFATKTGSRLFIPVNPFNRSTFVPDKVENRKAPVFKQYAFHDRDSIAFMLPDGFQPESVPKGKTIETPFGRYVTTIALSQRLFLYSRDLTINRGKWPKETYGDMIAFYEAIVAADKQKVVLKESKNP
ncbi:MAG: DUF3857 domain-containing protein [Marinilabiliales bacterium]|nr:DUF3857 domain-containing protein [Marinilabiliales bacterium]